MKKLAPSDSPRSQRTFTCQRHGWAAVGTACPECKAGDAPTICTKHGWAAVGYPCPDCQGGRP
jgi:hypothetical protein